jgi:outer membrane protein assembly factor BamB
MLVKFLRFFRRVDCVGRFLFQLSCFVVFAGGAASLLPAADWPMWRLDAARSAASEEQLTDSLTLHWTRQLAPPAPAWPADQGKVRFDASYEPIAVDGRLIVPSMSHDCVTAYDVENGRRLWRVYTDGPVRFAPAASGDRVLFASDDGFLYCLRAADGELCWKFRGGPSAQRVLGNDRLVSLWPARGAPVIQDGTVYFAAGIWPFMGTFIHALDVETGEVIWTNSGSGSTYLPQQHSGSVAFAGVAPQGYLSLSDDKLLVAGGMTVPAAYDRLTGKFLYYRLSERELGKQYGGYAVTAGEDWFSNHGGLYRLADGEPVAKLNVVVRDGTEILATTGRHLLGLQNNLAAIKTTKVDKKGKRTIEESEGLPEVWRCELPDPVKKIHLKAGRWIWASDGDASIYALEIDWSVAEEPTCRIAWKGDIEGTVWSMLVADQRLFVISLEGAVFCFGQKQSASQPIPTWSATEPTPTSQPPESHPAAESPVSSLLEMLPDRAGYAVTDGQHSDWAAELARTSDLHVIVMEPDAARRQALREQLERAQLLGQRVAVVSGHPTDGTLPPYLANLLITGLDPNLPADAAREAIAIAANSLRPYGGVGFRSGHRPSTSSRPSGVHGRSSESIADGQL